MNNTRFGKEYTPVVEEVRVGMEYKINTKTRGWLNKKIGRGTDTIDKMATVSDDLLNASKVGNYRCRYIDSKDVISLGWVKNNEAVEKEGDLTFDIRNVESTYENHWYMVLTEGEQHIDVTITLHTYSGVEKSVEDVTSANYTIKSKNDLLQLMLFKGITKDTRNQL